MIVLAIVCSFIKNDVVNDDMLIGRPKWIISILLNILLLKAFVPNESIYYSFHGPSWYLSVIFVFYIVVWIINNVYKKNRKKIYISGCLLAYFIQFIICIVVDLNDLETRKWLTYINPYFRICVEGFLGILIYDYMKIIQNKITNINKTILEIISTFGCIVFWGGVNNFITHSIFNAWIWFVPITLVMISFYSEIGEFSKFL